MNKFLEELQEKLTVQGMYVHNIKPLFNCPNWNRETEQPGTASFLNEIRPKIEIAAMFREQANAPLNDLPF